MAEEKKNNWILWSAVILVAGVVVFAIDKLLPTKSTATNSGNGSGSTSNNNIILPPSAVTSGNTTTYAISSNYLTGTTLYSSNGTVLANNVSSYSPQNGLVTLLNGSTITLTASQNNIITVSTPATATTNNNGNSPIQQTTTHPSTLTPSSITYTTSTNYLTGTTLYSASGTILASDVASYVPQYGLVTFTNGSQITVNPTQK